MIPKWHYAVIIGYDLEAGLIYLHTGIEKKYSVGWKVFKRTWKRAKNWGMVAITPHKVPASVDISLANKARYLNEIIGFERTQQWNTAITAYQTSLNKWTNNNIALIGLGNSYYQLKKTKEAEQALQKLISTHPGSAIGHNNLAQLLFETGKIKKAFSHAQQAVNIGGKHLSEFQKTLAAIKKHRDR